MYFLVDDRGTVIAKSTREMEGYLYTENFPSMQALSFMRWDGNNFVPNATFYAVVELNDLQKQLDNTDYKVIREYEKTLPAEFNRTSTRERIRELRKVVPNNAVATSLSTII